jgi:hypothetical protein
MDKREGVCVSCVTERRYPIAVVIMNIFTVLIQTFILISAPRSS